MLCQICSTEKKGDKSYCLTCGVDYKPISDEWILWIKAYWNQEKKFIGLANENGPQFVQGRDDLDTWLRKYMRKLPRNV